MQLVRDGTVIREAGYDLAGFEHAYRDLPFAEFADEYVKPLLQTIFPRS
jgi:hypothetical protein